MPKTRKMFFIDGFNLYHSLEREVQKDISLINAKWLDLEKLCSFYIDKNIEELTGVKYFTTLSWKNSSLTRQKNYISALLANNPHLEIIYGKFKQKNRFCPNCSVPYSGHEEKLTDVNIAIYLLENALKNTFDEAVIVSADSDLIPAVLAIRRNYPGKIVSILPPMASCANDLKNHTHKKYKMRKANLLQSQLPDNQFFTRPAEWNCVNYHFNVQTQKWEYNS